MIRKNLFILFVLYPFLLQAGIWPYNRDNINYDRPFGKSIHKELDSIVTYYADGSREGKIEYDYNKKSVAGYGWDNEKKEWVGSWRKYEADYNANGDMLYFYDYYWDVDLKVWIPRTKTDLTYTENNQILTKFQINWDQEQQQWINISRNIFNYNEYGNKLQQTFDRWDNDKKEWVEMFKEILVYDKRQNLVSDTAFLHGSVNDFNVFTYDEHDMKTKWVFYSWVERTQSFDILDSVLYENNFENRIVKECEYAPWLVDIEHSPYSETTRYYNDLWQEEEMIVRKWLNDIFQPVQREIYKYDSRGHLIENIRYLRDFNNQVFNFRKYPNLLIFNKKSSIVF